MQANQVIQQLCDEAKRTRDQLTTTIPNRKPTVGIRFPRLAEIAKQIRQSNPIEFLESNDCSIYELEILQTHLIGSLPDFHQGLHYFQRFSMIAREWSTVDSLCQHFTIAKKHRCEVFALLIEDSNIDDEYRQRIVAVMILSHFLTDEFIEPSLRLLDSLNHPGYYTRMAIAWAIASMMVHYSENAIDYLRKQRLDVWTHNKAIQKTLESFRVDATVKATAQSLRRA